MAHNGSGTPRDFSRRDFLQKTAATVAVLPVAAWFPAHDDRFRNGQYELHVLESGVLEIRGLNSQPVQFVPTFTVLHRPDDPDLGRSRADEVNFGVPSWTIAEGSGKTTDLFEAAKSSTVTASGVAVDADQLKLTWQFEAGSTFQMEAGLQLPEEVGDPIVRFQFTPRKSGWYSVGFNGSPAWSPENVDGILQPFVWQERRFPQRSYLSLEDMCSLPLTLVESNGLTVGVSADPTESPFRIPDLENARFGVMLRNSDGDAQPAVFAPVLGGRGSEMQAGSTFSFALRLIVRPGGYLESFRHIARGQFAFSDYRRNATCSLNETLENMVDYAMNDFYSGWVRELKACDYTTDVEGTVKLVSALHPLSLAFVTDNEDVYERRARPMIEYVMSREKYLFSIREGIEHQSPSHSMNGPCVEVSELAALFLMSRRRSPVFAHYAEELYDEDRILNLEMVSEAGSFQNALALYRMTGQPEYLNEAQAQADEYIRQRVSQPQMDFSDVRIEQGGQFWTDFAPKWVDLLELYEETGEERYLDAASTGAKLYATYAWLYPSIPDDRITINEGNQVGTHGYWGGNLEDPRPMRAPEQEVPAWRVSQIGLTPEASTTYRGNPAVLLTHYAAYMLRVASYTDDDLLRDIGRSAVVGRYANFPGYDINGEFTTIYQRPDYPLRPWEELTYNNIYYNHVWPHLALVVDYLVSDAFARSNGRIDFPSRYAQGYAYLQSKVYGDRAGRFYGDDAVHLWLPSNLLDVDTIQANYVAGYGNGNFYLALINQSNDRLEATVRLNPDIVPYDNDRSYDVEVWQENHSAPSTLLRNGNVTVPLAAKGITALIVDGLDITPQFQQKVLDAAAKPLSDESYLQVDSPFGSITGMIISMGESLTNAFVWLEATEDMLTEARLRYRLDGEDYDLVEGSYPFEFSVPVRSGSSLVFTVEGVAPEGERMHSGVMELMA